MPPSPQPTVPARPPITRRGNAAALILIAVTALASCDRLGSQSAEAVATRSAIAAIEAYATASSAANQRHRDVITAFARANAASSLAGYKDTLVKDVLPAMDRFLAALEGMPVATDDLARIHQILVLGYSEARSSLLGYVERLESADDLKAFDGIRGGLQGQVQRYQHELAAYYGRYNRKLHLAAGAANGPATAAPSPTAATPTSP